MNSGTQKAERRCSPHSICVSIGYSRVMGKITFDMLESENIYGRHRIQYKIDHIVSAVATSPPLATAFNSWWI